MVYKTIERILVRNLMSLSNVELEAKIITLLFSLFRKRGIYEVSLKIYRLVWPQL